MENKIQKANNGSLAIGQTLSMTLETCLAKKLDEAARVFKAEILKGDLRLWLKVFDGERPEIVDQGFTEYLKVGKFMPKPGDIQEQIRIIRQSFAPKSDEEQEKQDRQAIERYMAEHDGKTPSQVFVEENREWIRKMDMNLLGGSASSERNKKALNQSRVLGCESK